MNCKIFCFFLLLTLSARAEDTSTQYNLRLRKIGHLFLLAAGDHSSRVMPIQETSEGLYKLSFGKAFAFVPDSLVNVVTRSQLKGHYTVSVRVKGQTDIIYGFTSEEIRQGTAPCTGRPLPVAAYEIYIERTASGLTTQTYILAALFLSMTTTGGFLLVKRKKRTPGTGIPIGKYTFIPEAEALTLGKERTVLTHKEQTLLRIFLEHPNEIIDRNLLLKRGWEDEGVITGRSLDMYVSKLRKKFAQDEDITFKNVHGKGYSLCITAAERK